MNLVAQVFISLKLTLLTLCSAKLAEKLVAESWKISSLNYKNSVKLAVEVAEKYKMTEKQ